MIKIDDSFVCWWSGSGGQLQGIYINGYNTCIIKCVPVGTNSTYNQGC